MSGPLLGNPIPGYLHPKGWSRPAGNAEYAVVRTMADHQAAKQGNGTDIGNRKCGGPLLAMADCTVYSRYVQNTPGRIGHGSLIMRVRFADGRTSGNAHLASFSVALGAKVSRGQQLGVLGGSGGVPCHLHFDLREANGTPLDVLTQLEQNHNLQANAGANGVNLRVGPSTAAAIAGQIRTAGIYIGPTRVAGHDDPLLRRPVATVTANGYEWMPIAVPGSVPLWVARPFIHFL